MSPIMTRRPSSVCTSSPDPSNDTGMWTFHCPVTRRFIYRDSAWELMTTCTLRSGRCGNNCTTAPPPRLTGRSGGREADRELLEHQRDVDVGLQIALGADEGVDRGAGLFELVGVVVELTEPAAEEVGGEL